MSNFVAPSWYFPYAAPPLAVPCISAPRCVHLLCVSLTCSLPAGYIHHFSPPLLYVCLPSISLSLLLCIFTASSPPPASPSIVRPPLLLLCTWAFSQQLLQAFMCTLLSLPVFPHTLSPFFLLPFAYPLSLLICIPFFLPSFWYPVSLALFICTSLLSVSPLYHFSPVLSDLFSQIDSTGKMFCSCLQRCASLHCKPFSSVSNLMVAGLICRKILASYQHAHRVKSPKALSLSFFPHIAALLGSFPFKAK